MTFLAVKQKSKESSIPLKWVVSLTRHADIINHANLGIEVMHERNVHNFPLDLAVNEAPSTKV